MPRLSRVNRHPPQPSPPEEEREKRPPGFGAQNAHLPGGILSRPRLDLLFTETSSAALKEEREKIAKGRRENFLAKRQCPRREGDKLRTVAVRSLKFPLLALAFCPHECRPSQRSRLCAK